MNLEHHALVTLGLAAVAFGAAAQVAPAGAPAAATAASEAAQVSPAPASRVGPYVIAALGRSEYDYDCFSLFACDSARATSAKLGVGYRFGVFAIEGFWTDHGKAATTDPGGELRLRSLGVNAQWTIRFGAMAEGLLRVGMADIRASRRSGGVTTSNSHFQPTFGIGLGLVIAPNLALGLASDLTRADTSANIGSVMVNTTSLGLRVRF